MLVITSGYSCLLLTRFLFPSPMSVQSCSTSPASLTEQSSPVPPLLPPVTISCPSAQLFSCDPLIYRPAFNLHLSFDFALPALHCRGCLDCDPLLGLDYETASPVLPCLLCTDMFHRATINGCHLLHCCVCKWF